MTLARLLDTITLDYGKGGQLPAPGTWRLLRMLKQDSDFDRMIK
jgi:hypothetical protein